MKITFLKYYILFLNFFMVVIAINIINKTVTQLKLIINEQNPQFVFEGFVSLYI